MKKTCGLVWGKRPPCPLELDEKSRCPMHCRRKLRGKKGKLCNKFHTAGRDRAGCRLHGGRSKIGIATKQYKTGIYSKYVGPKLGELFASGPSVDLLDLNEDVKIFVGRIRNLLANLEQAISGKQWDELLAIHSEIQTSIKANDSSAMLTGLGRLDGFIKKGRAEWDLWEQIEQTALRKTRVVESQRKRALEDEELISREEARRQFRNLCDAIKAEIKDPALLNRVADRIARISAVGSGDLRMVKAGARGH